MQAIVRNTATKLNVFNKSIFDNMDAIHRALELRKRNWAEAAQRVAALQQFIAGITLVSNEDYSDDQLQQQFAVAAAAIKQHRPRVAAAAISNAYYIIDTSYMIPLQHTNIIKTRSITLKVADNQRPFSNNFVQLTASKQKNKIEATVLCTGNSNEPLCIYACAYNLQAQLISCGTLN